MPSAHDHSPRAEGATLIQFDYDENPERTRTARQVVNTYGLAGDVHPLVAERFTAEGLHPVLDAGCGDGELAGYLPPGWWVGLDRSVVRLRAAPRPAVLADAAALPFADGSFEAVAALWVLYHLTEPGLAIAEARRVLRPGGLLAVALPSRHDSPEFAHILPAGGFFDAETGPAALRAHFPDVEVRTWDAPLLRLPTRDAVRDFLVGKMVPPQAAEAEADATGVPVTVTKRGALLYGRAPA